MTDRIDTITLIEAVDLAGRITKYAIIRKQGDRWEAILGPYRATGSTGARAVYRAYCSAIPPSVDGEGGEK